MERFDSNRKSMLTFLTSLVRFTDPNDVKTLYINSKLCKIIKGEVCQFNQGVGREKMLQMAIVLQYADKLRQIESIYVGPLNLVG